MTIVLLQLFPGKESNRFKASAMIESDCALLNGRLGLSMNLLLSLKLLLIKHGRCSACKDNPTVKHCRVCFNTRLEPEVLEAITVLDLAEKFKESEKRLFGRRFRMIAQALRRAATSIMLLKESKDSKDCIQNL